MRHLLPFTLVLAAACGNVTDPAVEDPVDAAPAVDPDAAAPTCDVAGLAAYTPVPVVTRSVPPSATARPGETIHDVLQGQRKEHFLVAANDGRPRRGELFVWMSGSGAEPQNYDAIMNIAAWAGYDGVSLAYDNETSVNELCTNQAIAACDQTRNHDCEEEARTEMLYGREVLDSPCLDVPRADAIAHRILRLVQFLDARAPDAGFDAYLDASGDALVWSKIAIGGWSQGGGHAGLIARDHLVARALYVSKGAGAINCATTATDPLAACDANGDGLVDRDELSIPVPWAHDPRATPGGREFGAIHTGEDAWDYSREVFELFGMGAEGDALLVDGMGPYPAAYDAYGCAHVVGIAATPACGPTDFHKSMALDACLARDSANVPLLAPAYAYFLTVPVSPSARSARSTMPLGVRGRW